MGSTVLYNVEPFSYGIHLLLPFILPSVPSEFYHIFHHFRSRFLSPFTFTHRVCVCVSVCVHVCLFGLSLGSFILVSGQFGKDIEPLADLI